MNKVSFPKFEALPDLTQRLIAEHATLFSNRREALCAARGLKVASRNTNTVVNNSPTFRRNVANLLRHPRIESRFDAALKDIEAGSKASDAVSWHHVTSSEEENQLRFIATWGAVSDGTSVRDAIALHGLSDEASIDEIHWRILREDMDNGSSAPDAIARHGMVRDVRHVHLYGASCDMARGHTAAAAIARHGVTEQEDIDYLMSED